MRDLAYIFDQHEISAAEAAAMHVSKWWTPLRPYVQVVLGGHPVSPLPGEEWLLYQAQVSVTSYAGLIRQGVQIKLYTLGPPGHGGIALMRHQQGAFSVFTGTVPTKFGIGWGVWPGGAVIATDIVQFNAVYRVVKYGA